MTLFFDPLLLHNCVDGVAERLGVTLKQLQQINPDVITCQFSAHGGLYRNCGGWEKRAGFDPNAQAVSGIMTGYGTLERPQLHGNITCGDIMGGIGGTFAALLAVFQKQKTGVAGEARSSLDRMINYIQLPGMIAENGHCNWGEPRGQFALGEALWKRMYLCSDRWIYVETSEQGAAALKKTVTGRVDTANEADLEEAFREQDHTHWLETLQAENIACHVVADAQDIIAQPMRKVDNEPANETAEKTFELMIREDHPAGEPIVNLVPSWVRVGEDRSYKRLTPATRYGQHTQEILSELGYSSAEIKELIKLKVSHDYLPSVGGKSYFFNPEKQH